MLDYFVRQREGLLEDHVLFSFEQSMTFSKAEFALTDQVGQVHTEYQLLLLPHYFCLNSSVTNVSVPADPNSPYCCAVTFRLFFGAQHKYCSPTL